MGGVKVVETRPTGAPCEKCGKPTKLLFSSFSCDYCAAIGRIVTTAEKNRAYGGWPDSEKIVDWTFSNTLSPYVTLSRLERLIVTEGGYYYTTIYGMVKKLGVCWKDAVHGLSELGFEPDCLPLKEKV